MTEGERLRSNPRHKDRVPVIVRWQSADTRTPQTLKLSVPKQMKLVGRTSGFLPTVQAKVKDIDFSKVCMSIKGNRLDHAGVDAGRTVQKLDEEYPFPDHILYVDLETIDTEHEPPQPRGYEYAPQTEPVPMTVAEPAACTSQEQVIRSRSDEDLMENVASLHVVHLADNEDLHFDDIDYDDWNQQQSSIKGKSAEAKRVLEKHPGRVPVHCQEADAVPPRVKKLLPPNHMTVEELKRVCWKHFQCPVGASEATRKDAPLPIVELAIGNMSLEHPSQTMEDLYGLYKSNTGLLQVSVRFGPDMRYEDLQEEVRHLTEVVAGHEQAQQQAMVTLQDMTDLCNGKDAAVETAEKAKQEAREAEARCIELELEWQQRLSKVQEELIERINQNAQLEVQMKEMLAAMEDQRQQNKALQADLAVERSAKENLAVQMKETRAAMESQRQQNQGLQADLAVERSAKENLAVQMKETRAAMESQRQQNQGLQADLAVERSAKENLAATLEAKSKEEDHFDEGFLVVQDRVQAFEGQAL